MNASTIFITHLRYMRNRSSSANAHDTETEQRERVRTGRSLRGGRIDVGAEPFLDVSPDPVALRWPLSLSILRLHGLALPFPTPSRHLEEP